MLVFLTNGDLDKNCVWFACILTVLYVACVSCVTCTDFILVGDFSVFHVRFCIILWFYGCVCYYFMFVVCMFYCI